MKFVLKDNTKYMIPAFLGRLHIATVQYGFRTFVCFQDRFTGKKYIEEDPGFGDDFLFIKDNSLVLAIEKFLDEKGITDIRKPDIPDETWLKNPTSKKYF